MSDSIVGSLLNMLDKRAVGEVAHAIGQSEHSVGEGMGSSIAAILGAMASKSQDPGALQKVLDTVPSTAGPVSWSQIAGAVADPTSSLLTAGTRALPALFGSGESAVTRGIGRSSGLSPGVISILLTMAGPVVISFLTKRLRDTGMNKSDLGFLLQRESGAIRNALPSEVSELFWPGTATAGTTASPVVAQAVEKETSFNWLPALAIAGLGIGMLAWFVGHARRPSVDTLGPPASTGTASRMAIPAPKMLCSVPTNVDLPEGEVGARLLSFVQNPDATLAANTWFNVDQMAFDSGSAKLRPESQAQLDNIGTVLRNCPAVHLEIAGYTDSVGDPESNRRLSRSRANAVVAQLVSQGVSQDRLTTAAYAEENALADNTSEQGRAQNRRFAIRVTQK